MKPSADIITPGLCMDRLCTDAERPWDRKYIATFSLAIWRKRWRRAQEENDFAAMDTLDREYEQIMSL